MRKIKLLLAVLVLMAVLPGKVFSQNTTITGTVMDGTGHPVIGASVLLSASNRGTDTDADGKFKIVVPPHAALIISASVYLTSTIEAARVADGLVVKLSEDVTHLDEVV